MATIRGDMDYVRVLLYSHYTPITGWGGPPKVEAQIITNMLVKGILA